MKPGRIVFAGGSGYLGRLLAAHLTPLGWDPVVLTRHPNPNASPRETAWDGRSLGPWTAEIDGAAAVLNLAGRSVNCRFTEKNKRAVMDSRVDSTRVIGEAISRCEGPPAVWLNASTATLYQHTLGPAHDENSRAFDPTPEVKDEFSVQVAHAWENALFEKPLPRTRRVALRISLVFGTVKGGVFQILRNLLRFGLGGRMGDGRQFVSWIHEVDFCRAVEWLLQHEEFSGPVNIAAPHPVTNGDMMRIFRRQCGIPLALPAARWMLETGALIMSTETELLLKSRRVVPGKLMASGFTFQYATMDKAVAELKARAAA